ncbi:hypothetical protein [Lutibacter sp.]
MNNNNHQKIFELIVEKANELYPSKNITKNSPLIGDNAKLDSMELVTFLVEVEQEINERFNTTISLMSERAMSRSSSPFRNVEALVEYILELINE